MDKEEYRKQLQNPLWIDRNLSRNKTKSWKEK